MDGLLGRQNGIFGTASLTSAADGNGLVLASRDMVDSELSAGSSLGACAAVSLGGKSVGSHAARADDLFRDLPALPQRHGSTAETEASRCPPTSPMAGQRSPCSAMQSNCLVHGTLKADDELRASTDLESAPVTNLRKILSNIATVLADEMRINSASSGTSLDNPLRQDIYPLMPPPAVPSAPKSADIFATLIKVFQLADLPCECAVIMMVYIRRITSATGIPFSGNNWMRFLLGSILLASKVWDDNAVWNTDFCRVIFPEMLVSDMNLLERWFIGALNFDVQVTPAEYSKCAKDIDLAARSMGQMENDREREAVPLLSDRILARMGRIGAKLLRRQGVAPPSRSADSS